MPQLIAMIIIVVGAMIYMFQTFGGTGDKIEGIAQKTSIITEINNIRNGLQLAVRAGDIKTNTTLVDLANLGYFAEQMNQEIKNNTATVTASDTSDLRTDKNTYSAISFGGENNPGLFLTLVKGNKDTRPGIRVQFTGALDGNKGFLESQISTDLQAVAAVDRKTKDGSAVALKAGSGEVPKDNRPASIKDTTVDPVEAGTLADNASEMTDGVFTVYFRDMPELIVAP